MLGIHSSAHQINDARHYKPWELSHIPVDQGHLVPTYISFYLTGFMSSNPGRVEFGVHNTSVLSRT